MSDVFELALSYGGLHPYKVVTSKRAKYIRIKLSQFGELSVVRPVFSDISLVHDFVLSKQHWIEKNLQKVTLQKKVVMPEALDLQLINEHWDIIYTNVESATHLSLTEEVPEENSASKYLRIKGDETHINDFELVSKLLHQWCKKKAQTTFNVMLQDLAEVYGFHYHRLSIRSQKTRWGSCSSKKNINLNCKLLFMPEPLVKYVMIHELCHTIEMNHSSRFWKLVEECDPHYKTHQKQLHEKGKTLIL